MQSDVGSAAVGTLHLDRESGGLRTLLLYYDEFHTPYEPLQRLLPHMVALHVGLDAPSEVDVPPAVDRIDGASEFCERFVLPAIKANAMYRGGYLLCAALSRPLLAELAVRHAKRTQSERIVHGFAGNDQLRFEIAVRTLHPACSVTSVVSLLGSQQARHDGDLTISENLWGRSAEAGPLEDPAREPPAAVYQWTPGIGGDTGVADIAIEFERGRPVALDGRRLELRQLIADLNGRAGSLGTGVVDLVEDGYVGLKSRAVYEAPAATVLITAHRDLERLTCSRRQNDLKPVLDDAWANLVYEGAWYDPLRVGLETYTDAINTFVSGEVRVRMQGAGVSVVGRTARAGLYREGEAIYRVGQDTGVEGVSAMAQLLAGPMRVAREREIRTARGGERYAPSHVRSDVF